MVLVKKWNFLHLFISATIGKKKAIGDILERKNGFPDYENKEQEKSKNRLFSNGVSTWFWSKNGIFSTFLFLAN